MAPIRRDSLRFVPFLKLSRWKLIVEDPEKPHVWTSVELHPRIPRGWWKRPKY